MAAGAFESNERVRHSAPVFVAKLRGGEAGLDDGHKRLAVLLLERELLHDWIFDAATDEDRAILQEMLDNVGAIVMGRTSFDKNEGSQALMTPAATHLGFRVVR